MEKRLDNFGLAPAEIGAVEKQIADLKVCQHLMLILPLHASVLYLWFIRAAIALCVVVARVSWFALCTIVASQSCFLRLWPVYRARDIERLSDYYNIDNQVSTFSEYRSTKQSWKMFVCEVWLILCCIMNQDTSMQHGVVWLVHFSTFILRQSFLRNLL